MTEHPSVETLLDLTLGELSDEHAAEVRDHLIDCEACRVQVQSLLDTSDEPPAGHEPVSRFEKEAARRDLARAMRDEGFASAADRLAKGPETKRPEGERQAAEQPWRVLGLAAAVGLVAFGLGSWFGSSEVGAVKAEERASWGAVTMPAVDPVRGPSAEAPSTCPGSSGTSGAVAGESFVWFVETPENDTSEPVVDIEVIAPDGTVEPRLEGGVPDEYGRLVIVRPVGITPDGIYTIRWFVSGGTEPLAEQRIRVACGQ